MSIAYRSSFPSSNEMEGDFSAVSTVDTLATLGLDIFSATRDGRVSKLVSIPDSGVASSTSIASSCSKSI
eukprot:CAMPEP_0116082880 /NCGR_PEP_ID=MMETSP0327-20121206/2967_1 /TAXON_ID=44447 /ORGANISM="Pseudo-nitzschia delicatissima, Strain B596" /LENGTH=69 /DNA_ID=CAMNT_0003573713 /DNA_START=1123 /DNA_END=1329 /DNA_ORIENTATION=+